MAMQKAKPAVKKIVKTKATGAAKKTAPAVAKPKTTKTPAVKKVAAAKPPAKKAVPAKVTTTKATAAKKTAAKPTPEERYRMVETAAYFIAERHGFQGNSAEHWTAAEKEIAERLGV